MISESTGKNTTDYTYGLERISALTGSNRTEYIYDARGSVAAEVSYNNAWYTFGGTLGWKNVTSRSYTPFGEQIGEAASGFGSRAVKKVTTPLSSCEAAHQTGGDGDTNLVVVAA